MAAILIVDDEAGIREFLAEALAADGHQTTTSADAVEALGSLRAREFDMMITDLKMPGPLDGVGLLRQVGPERPDMPVIVLTAHGTVETAVEAMKLGAFDFLEKPLGSPGQLRVLVWRALERRKALVRDAARETRRVPPLPGDDPMGQLAREVERVLGTGYQVEELIGRGGYAVVFRVYDRHLERDLAVKALYPELAARAAIADQFRREARTAARLRHPNIVPVLFVGMEGDVPCLVMPLVEGEPLSARLRREGPLDLAQVLDVTRDVAGALDFAHEARVIHRDVKPDNILLERATGRSLLTDFGIAKALTDDTAGTAPGVVMGTPYYVSPEQAAGERELDPRSDIYSFAVVVYEMLAGRPPFDGPSARKVFAQHVSAPVPPLRARRPDLSGEAEAVVARALAKNPAARYATAGEFAQALEQACRAQTGPVRRAPAPQLPNASPMLRARLLLREG